MSPLFRRSEEKVARREAAKREVDRLKALSVDDLAALLLPGLGPDGPSRGTTTRVQQLAEHLLQGFPDAGHTTTLSLLPAVRRALERLHQLGLVEPIYVQRDPLWRITPAGRQTLADGTIRQRLGGAA